MIYRAGYKFSCCVESTTFYKEIIPRPAYLDSPGEDTDVSEYIRLVENASQII
jgi:hypothetical protein